MFPIGEKKIAMTRIKEIMEIVRKCKNMNDPEICAIIIEFHNLAKEQDLYEWADKENGYCPVDGCPESKNSEQKGR